VAKKSSVKSALSVREPRKWESIAQRPQRGIGLNWWLKNPSGQDIPPEEYIYSRFSSVRIRRGFF
jgi:hypothetical protein